MQIQYDFQKYFDANILNIRNLKHNGNNQLFKVSTDSKNFLLKKYSPIHMDNWLRCEKEFSALNHLWQADFREIPEPIESFKKENISIYSFEKGEILNPSDASKKEIKQLSDFLVKLHSLGNEHKTKFGLGSCACLNLQEYVNGLDRRIAILFNYDIRDPINDKACTFFKTKVLPCIEKTKEIFYEKTNEFDLKKELGLEEQVLTPGDFGFHNVLFDNKKAKFLDFEYFGRDDPARQILQFLHHIKSNDISSELKAYFLKSYTEKNNSLDFLDRLKLIEPLIAMDWLLIPMNVFSKQRMERLDIENPEVHQMLEQRISNTEKKLKEIEKD